MKRGNANNWLLIFLTAIILVAGVALAQRYWSQRVPVRATFIADTYAPAFQVGDLAPDFSLPDRKGQVVRLSQWVHGDTLLWFTCGCARCRELQTVMGRLARQLGRKAPASLSVTTAIPEAEESYLHATDLPQVILYSPPTSTIWQRYRGHPCPRVFRLKRDRTVAWIGPAPGATSPAASATALAAALGVDRLTAARAFQAVHSSVP